MTTRLFTDVQGSVNRGPLAEGTGFTAGRRKPVCAGGRLNDAISMMRQQRKPVICARPPRGEQPVRRSGLASLGVGNIEQPLTVVLPV